MDSNQTKVVGVQVGGNVGPNDRVGMYVAMPVQPGVGVSINVNDSLVNSNIKEIISSIPGADEKSTAIKKVATEILEERDKSVKLQKIKSLIQMGADFATIAQFVLNIRHLVGMD